MTPTDDGYFPRGSMLRRVMEIRSVGRTYGRRALILGATHPLPYVGTSEHTHAKDRPWQRLTRTALAFEAVYFGSRAEADAVLARVHRMHDRVKGELRSDEGAFAAGTRYDAYDPDLMLWTMGVLADSSRVAYETTVGRLDDDERQALWEDWRRFGRLFGMSDADIPARIGDFDAWLADHVDGPAFHVTEEARVVGRAIAHDVPVPLPLRLPVKGVNHLVVGMLPTRVRRAFGFTWTPFDELTFQALAAAVRRSHSVVPDSHRIGRNRRLFEAVAAAERRILDAGGVTIDLPAAG